MHDGWGKGLEGIDWETPAPSSVEDVLLDVVMRRNDLIEEAELSSGHIK